jgi:hypothetical protein
MAAVVVTAAVSGSSTENSNSCSYRLTKWMSTGQTSLHGQSNPHGLGRRCRRQRHMSSTNFYTCRTREGWALTTGIWILARGLRCAHRAEQQHLRTPCVLQSEALPAHHTSEKSKQSEPERDESAWRRRTHSHRPSEWCCSDLSEENVAWSTRGKSSLVLVDCGWSWLTTPTLPLLIFRPLLSPFA